VGILPASQSNDDDGDYGDETVLLTSTQVDDDWSGGHVGLFRGNQDTNTHQFDDFKVGYDNNADGDFDDVIAIDDNFGDSVTNGAISLSYDANGNLTDDGIFAYAYDAWNRLRLAKLVGASDSTTIGDYEYYGDNRRSVKAVTNQGPTVTTHDDGGDVTIRTLTDRHGRILERRDGSGQTLLQCLRGASSELVWVEKNGDPAIGDDTDPDAEVTGEDSESPTDARYFAHQDRDQQLTLWTEYGTGGTNNGRVVERVAAHAERRVYLTSDNGSGGLGAICLTSRIANVADIATRFGPDIMQDVAHPTPIGVHGFFSSPIDPLMPPVGVSGNLQNDLVGLCWDRDGECCSCVKNPEGCPFNRCCCLHDRCYCRPNGRSRLTCDREFLDCMLARAYAKLAGEPHVCGTRTCTTTA
jgi:hypothetical protein